jgi:hypothetical protein
MCPGVHQLVDRSLPGAGAANTSSCDDAEMNSDDSGQPTDSCDLCLCRIRFPNAVFVIGDDNAIQLLCEQCVADFDDNRTRPL